MTGSQIREKLRNGQPTFGTHVTSLMNPLAMQLTTELQMDFAFFCTEHMPIDRAEIGFLCNLFAGRGISPIVRVASVDTAAISCAVDGGAEGIVVPYVETEEEVRRIVGAVKYRPIKGKLLQQAMNGQPLPPATTRFLEDFNRNQYVIIGIESMPAIENLEALLSAADVDGVFLGPHDITTSMGIPTEYHHPKFIDLIVDVIRRCRRCGVGVGLHMPLLRLGNEPLQRLFEAGMNWVINGSDVTIMRDAMNGQLQQLRKMSNHLHSSPATADADRRAVQQTCIA